MTNDRTRNNTTDYDPMLDLTATGERIVDINLLNTASQRKLQPSRRFNLNAILKILLVFNCVLLVIALLVHANPQWAAATIPASDTPTDVAANPLPAELTDVNSLTFFVDPNHSVPTDYIPADLETPYVSSTGEVIQVRAAVAEDLKAMINAANEAGAPLILTAGYVSFETQEDYFTDRVAMVGEAEALKITPKPGFSEHQTGLAVDFSDKDDGTATTTAFAESAAGKWLKEHAHEYGFIMRYPEGKEEITSYSYQPWHYRYVGKDVANAMYAVDPNLTFEEYFNTNK
ncbi:MAG: M15 family metallopeptidase [Solobacterium sp.]|nr:M15 family metallopeptidase [Solobacterium sp.]